MNRRDLIVFSREWFEYYQTALLWFANTKIGKYTLRIHGNRSDVGKNKITKIEPNAITWKSKGGFKTEFRTYNKYSKHLYHGFKPFWHLLHAWDMGIANNLMPQLNAGFDTLTVTDGYDDSLACGIVARNPVSESLSTIRAGAGTSGSRQKPSYVYIDTYGGVSANQYGHLTRAIELYDTSSLSGTVVTSAVMSLRGSSKNAQLGFPTLHITSSNPASDTAISSSDYSNLGSTSFGSILYGSFSTTGYNNITLNSSGVNNINTTGISKFGMRLGWDLNNTTSGIVWQANRDSGFTWRDSGTSTESKLIIEYDYADLYWVGDTGNWSDSSNWSTTSGGAGGAGVPTENTNVYFDANSFSGAGQTVTLDVATGYCKSMDWTGATNSPTFSTGSFSMRTYGSLTLIPSMTLFNLNWYMAALSGSHSITSAGKTFSSISFGFEGGTGTWTIQDDLTSSSTMILYQGSLNANNFDVTAGSFNTSTRAALKTITMGGGTWTITSGGLDISVNPGFLTLNANTSKLIISSTSGTSKTVNTSTFTLYDIEFSGNNITWTGATTVRNLEINNAGLASGLALGTGTKTVTGTITTNGSSGNLAILKSSSLGTARTITKSSGTVTLNYMDIKDSTATGGAIFYAGRQSTDSGNNTGWIFTNPSHPRQAQGTLTFSGSALRVLSAFRSAVGTLTFSSSVLGIVKPDTSTIEKKTFMYKVYDEDNNFLGVWDDVIDEPNWSQEINTTGSAQTILLARNSDSLSVATETLQDNTGAAIKDNNNFDILTTTTSRNQVGPGSNVNHNYRVDIYIFYGETTTIDDNTDQAILDNDGEPLIGTIGAPNGIRRFTGFISEININYGDNENTQVQLMSYGFDLDQYPVVDGVGATTVAFNSTDPGNMVQDGLDQFTADGINTFTTYSSATVELTSTTPSYTFRNNTYKELLETAVKLAPQGWFFFVGLGDNLVRFKPKPTTPRHTFYLGKHIKNLNLRSYIGDAVNDVLFTGGGDPALYKRYTEAPVTGTRRGLARISDSRVELEVSADILSEGEIDEKKNIQYRSVIEILDKTYDIESIDLGDLVAFRNFDNNVDLITMQIVALNYTPDVITLALDTLAPSPAKRLEELRKALDAQENLYVPDTPDS